MTHEHLPIEQGDARFLMSPPQADKIGEAITRFPTHVPVHWQPRTDDWRPTMTLRTEAPKNGWHRTSYFDDLARDPESGRTTPIGRVTISAWRNTLAPYSRGPEACPNDGVDVTMQSGDGSIQTAYISMPRTDGSVQAARTNKDDRRAWMVHRKLVDGVWQGDDPGTAGEALAFADDAFRKYVGYPLGIIAVETPPARQRHWLLARLRSLVSSGKIDK